MKYEHAKAFAIVGGPNIGKTTLTRSIVADIGAVPLVYDVYGEWGGRREKMDDFLLRSSLASHRLVVIEEATLFFDPKMGRPKLLFDALISRYHTGNAYLLLFHALSDIPLAVLRNLNGVYLLKTLDTENDLRRLRGFPSLLDAFDRVKASADLHAHERVLFRL